MADIKNITIDGTTYDLKDDKARNDITDLKEDLDDVIGAVYSDGYIDNIAKERIIGVYMPNTQNPESESFAADGSKAMAVYKVYAGSVYNFSCANYPSQGLGITPKIGFSENYPETAGTFSVVEYFTSGSVLDADYTPTKDGYVTLFDDNDANIICTFVPYMAGVVELIRTGESIDDGAITPSKTNFFHISPNLFNKNDITKDYGLNKNNGAFYASSGRFYSGKIPVTENEYYFFYGGWYNVGFVYVFYNDADTYITGDVITGEEAIQAPTGATYLRIGDYYNYNNQLDKIQVNKGATKQPYEPYGVTYLYYQYAPKDTDFIVNLPSKIYALVGFECNIWFDNIVSRHDTDYDFDVTCAKGMQLERGYRITPTSADVGSYDLSIKVTDKYSGGSVVKNTTLVVTGSSAGSGVTRSLIVLGDSTTDNDYALQKLVDNFSNDVMAITLHGTRETTNTPPIHHEGRAGWSTATYNTSGAGGVTNPFYKDSTNTFDATYYFDNSGVSVPNWFIINLGINDMFNLNDQNRDSILETVVTRINEMIDSVKTASNTVKVGVALTIPPNYSQDAFGKGYGCDETRTNYKLSNAIFVNRLIDELDNKTNQRVYLIPIYANLDTRYNMTMEDMAYNSRNSDTYKSPNGNGAVHPHPNGYWEIMDSMIAFLKANA